MPNAARKETAEQPSPSISPDFLTGSTEIGLDRIRTRLLDLTNRNKLLNYRHSNVSSLRVVEVGMPAHFAQFIQQRNSPGLLLIHSRRPIGSVIESLLLAWMIWTEEELRNEARCLP